MIWMEMIIGQPLSAVQMWYMVLHYCISIDGKDIFIKGRVYADDIVYLVIDLQFQR